MSPRIRGALAALAVSLSGALALASEAEAGGGHGGVKPVIPTTVWGILIFATVLIILWKKAFPPILEGLDRRARSIKEALEAAEKARVETAALMAQHEESLEKAKVEARAIIEEGKADAQKVKDGIVESAKKESREIADRARREIELAKQTAIDEIHQRSVGLAMEIARKVIHKALKAEDHKELIQEAVRKFKEAG